MSIGSLYLFLPFTDHIANLSHVNDSIIFTALLHIFTVRLRLYKLTFNVALCYMT